MQDTVITRNFLFCNAVVLGKSYALYAERRISGWYLLAKHWEEERSLVGPLDSMLAVELNAQVYTFSPDFSPICVS